MLFLRRLVRLITLSLVFVVPCCLLGAAGGGLSGGIAGVTVGLVAFLIFLLISEWLLLRRQPGARSGLTPALAASFRQALESEKCQPSRAPRMRVLMHPAPRVTVLRGWLSRGSISISEGLLAVLTEQELRELMVSCIRRNRLPGVHLRTFSLALAVGLASGLPIQWVRVFFPDLASSLGPNLDHHSSVTVFGLLRALIVFPTLRVAVWIGSLPAPAHELDRNAFLWDAVHLKMRAPGSWEASAFPL